MDASDHRSGTLEFTTDRYSLFFKINSTFCTTTTDMMIDQALTYIHHGAKKQRLIIFD